MRENNLTARILREMLTENTGRHFLDSGGAYGRNWERNQLKNFEKTPAVTLDFKYGIEVTLDVYHWLLDRVEYDAPMQRSFTRFVNSQDEDMPWLTLMEEFVTRKGATGLYGEGPPLTVNTYNGDDLLSQTLQYTYFELDGYAYVLLQIHGGCDVRGGYTRPRVFRAFDECGDMFDNAKAAIGCIPTDAQKNQLAIPELEPVNTSHFWATDDAYNWYYDGSTVGKKLQEYEITEDETQKGLGVLYIDEDGKGYCPICGNVLAGFP